MDADRLPPHLRRVVDAAETVDERLLVLLFVRKAEPAPDLAEMLGLERSELVAALGRLSQAGLVSHQRPEGEPIHWFATREGKVQGERHHRAIASRLVAEPEPEVGDAGPEADRPAEPGGEPGEHQRVKSRRRVAIDQNEKTGFSWD